MGIEIPITGMPDEISEIEQGKVILIEGGEDSLARYLSQRIAHEYSKKGRSCIMISSRPESLVNEDLKMIGPNSMVFDIYEEVHPSKFSKAFSSGSMVVVDRLDYIMGKNIIDDPHKLFEDLGEICRSSDSILILVSRIGGMEGPIDKIIKHNVDGIIQFSTIEKQEGISRYMRFIKWTDGLPYDNYIPFKYHNNKFNIDLRSKVI